MKVDTTKLTVRQINRKLAKEMIVKNHYSHKWTKCSVALGLFYSDGSQHKFFDMKDEKFIGTICYGDPIGRHSGASISTEIDRENVYELVRLFIHDGYGDNIESYLIGQGFKWLKENKPNIKGLISYADPQEGHVGTIYQATNWIYQGNKMRLMGNYGVKLTEDGDWMHSRTVFAKYGSHNLEHLKKKIGHTFWRKNETMKHRYLYLLCGKKDKKKIMKTLKHPPLPYIKLDEGYKGDEIEKIVVEEKEDKFYE